MPQRCFCFVVVLVLLFNGEIFSQKNSTNNSPSINNHSPANFEFENVSLIDWAKDSVVTKEKAKPVSRISKLHSPLLTLSRPPLLQSFYTNHIGFFCKKELQIEKITSVPFRFRLGSLDYVNYMERKPNALNPR
ncbi:MAG TPA: hypothetical protein VI461_13490 [Chitinophagaceae bacterium]|nr:hypothetical protein [Chitinophagaceae bacterium]